MNKRGLGGFALPTVLIASIIMMVVLLSAVGSSTAVRSAITDQYYNQLARSASDSGLAYAQACMESNGITWSDTSPLGPNTDCYGVQLAGFSCVDNYSEPRCFASFNNRIVSTFSVKSPEVDATGEIKKISSKGTTSLLRSSDNTARRQYSYTSQFVLEEPKFSSIQLLVVAGGGGGVAGGGGAGGIVYNSSLRVVNGSYNVTVGDGGAGGVANAGAGRANGQNSVFDNIIAIGGGAGGTNDSTASANAGGSGGGGGSTSTVQTNGGSSTSGQGNIGGTVTSGYFATPFPSAGGGGAGAAGGNPTGATVSGNGGVGTAYSITGSSVYYGGGGGGGTWANGTHGTGGTGGGGAGGYPNGTAGTVNTGGGGGGGAGGGSGSGGKGGSGIVIISYPTGSITATGGTITTNSGNTIHTFTSGSGTFTVVGQNIGYSDFVGPAQVLVVAGGGGGGSGVNMAGNGGGGGGGGVVYNSSFQLGSGDYTVVVGNGGSASTNGQDSSFGSIISVGGGRGGSMSLAPGIGGSGGGGGSTNTIGASGTAGQGFSGANFNTLSPFQGGGGGGGGELGNTDGLGHGGDGVQNSITGASIYYGGGGGGGADASAGIGGLGGGGDGVIYTSLTGGVAGTANTGGGGGGGSSRTASATGGTGGSGVVIISYPTGSINATGGTITTNGVNTIHKFTSGGTFSVDPPAFSGAVQVLAVAGGGGGSASTWGGGGGGGGGVIYNQSMKISTGSIAVTVGSGGAPGATGQDSYFGSLKAYGGGASGTVPAGNGGSGGGSGHATSQPGGNSIQTNNNGGAGYGNYGGAIIYADPYNAGSGGGAGAPGSNAGGPGGVGMAFTISGASVYYAGGGGMTNNNGVVSAGGAGGGGAGGNLVNGVNGTANTGGGGGGSRQASGGSGGSGIVIVSYPTGSIVATGGTITTSGGNTIHTFTTSGTFNVSSIGAWRYKRAITVTNSNATTLTNNQIKVTPFTDAAFLNNTGLVGSWHFNEGSGTKTIDSSGNNNTGTFSGSSYWSTSGKYGSSFTNSLTNGMSLSNGNDANVTGDITVEAWIYPTSFSNNTIVHKDGQYSLTIESSGNITWADSSNWSFANFGSKNIGLVTNQWQHIVATKTGGTVKIYLNGVEKVSQAFGGALTSTANVMSIGCYSNATACYSSSYFMGKIDEVKVYNRALSSDEVKLRYGPLGVPKIRSDYADIRFTNAAGTVSYPYWQESDKTFWVKIPSLAVGNTNINMIYGNPNAASSSNGDNTFPFFDNFSGSVISSVKWAELDAKASIAQSNGLVLTTVTSVWDSALISKTKFNRTAGLTVNGAFKAGASVVAPKHVMVGWSSDQEADPVYNKLVHGVYYNAGSLANVYEMATPYAGVGTYVANSFNLFEVKLKTTGANYYNNGSALYTGVGGSFATSPMRIGIHQHSHDGTFNYIFVRQGSTTEPTHSAPAAETTLFNYFRL